MHSTVRLNVKRAQQNFSFRELCRSYIVELVGPGVRYTSEVTGGIAVEWNYLANIIVTSMVL